MKVTIGKYIEKNSIVHSIDPRCKLICTMIYTIAIFFVQTNPEYLVPGILILISMILSKVSLKTYLRGILSIAFLIAFAVIVQLVYEGIYEAIYISLRLILILLAAEVLTFTTKPTTFAAAMEDILRMFGTPKASAQEFSMIMTIAIRFAPIMFDEVQRITKAQMSRGAPIDSGKIHQRIKALVAVVVPLIASAIRRAEELSLAMEVRKYKPGADRTRYYELKWKLKDTLALLLFVGVAFLLALV